MSPMISAALAMAMAVGFAVGGYKIGLEQATVIELPGTVEYVDVPGPTRVVNVPYEVQVPGPKVYIPTPGPVIVRKVFVSNPRHCPPEPSVADALNEYEAVSQTRRERCF